MSIEWLGLSHAKLSGSAVVGGSGTGGPLPARGEPRSRVIGAGPGGGAFGIKAQGGKEDALQVRSRLWVDDKLLAMQLSQQPGPLSALLSTLPFTGQKPEAQTWCG